MDIHQRDPEELLLPSEFAALLRVDPKTVTRWVRAGLMQEGEVVRTPGGYLRIKYAAVLRIMSGGEL